MEYTLITLFVHLRHALIIILLMPIYAHFQMRHSKVLEAWGSVLLGFVFLAGIAPRQSHEWHLTATLGRMNSENKVIFVYKPTVLKILYSSPCMSCLCASLCWRLQLLWTSLQSMIPPSCYGLLGLRVGQRGFANRLLIAHRLPLCELEKDHSFFAKVLSQGESGILGDIWQ